MDRASAVREVERRPGGPRPGRLWLGPLTKGAALCLLGLVTIRGFFLAPVLVLVGGVLMAVGTIGWAVQKGIESAQARTGER